jgi:hypothetical protein
LSGAGAALQNARLPAHAAPNLLFWSLFDAFPEPHDAVQNLKVVHNRIYIGRRESAVFGPLHFLANISPKWWERLFYVSNVEVKLKKSDRS